MSLRDDPAYRAHTIIFGHWRRQLEAWFDDLARASTIPLDGAIKPRLVDALFEAQRSVLEFAVDVDLKILEPSQVLYRNFSNKTDDLNELFVRLKDADELQAFRPTAPIRKTKHHTEAYDFYCTTIISTQNLRLIKKLNVWKAKWRTIGIFAFLERQPISKTFLNRIFENFTSNLKECIDRVSEDLFALQECFIGAGSRITGIADLIVSDSDPHKGGKRVVILTFAYTPDGGGAATKRVVYKPSDLEIDYRLAGRNTVALKGLLATKEDIAGYQKGYPRPPYESLYELIDRVAFADINLTTAEQAAEKKGIPGSPAYDAEHQRVMEMLALPTYLILPRNPGSRMTERGGALPIRNAYGYMEYLKHEPALPDVTKSSMQVDQEALERLRNLIISEFRAARMRVDPEWDWITGDYLEARTAFRLWGRLMMIMCLFLHTDLHWDNQRIRRRKPYLIDLENCLVKATPTPLDTMIPSAYARAAHGKSARFVAEVRAKQDTANSPLKFGIIPAALGFNQNQLYLIWPPATGTVPWDGNAWRIGTTYTPNGPRGTRHGNSRVNSGISEGLNTLSSQREAISQWRTATRLADCLVRFVPDVTQQYAVFIEDFCKAVIDEQAQPMSQRRSEDAILDALLNKKREKWDKSEKKEADRRFLLESPDRNGADYKNLDIPFWCRRVDSRDILSSTGIPVQNYFNLTGVELLDSSFQSKLLDNPIARRRLLKDFTKFLRVEVMRIIPRRVSSDPTGEAR